MSKKLLITDVDETVAEFVPVFCTGLNAMVSKAVEITGVDEKTIRDQLRESHRAFASIEQPYALIEIPCIQDLYVNETPLQLVDRLSPALQAFEDAMENLSLFPTVLDTIIELKNRGVTVVAFTDAPMRSVYKRLNRLGVIDHLDALYAVNCNYGPHPDPNYIPDLWENLRPVPLHLRKPAKHQWSEIMMDFRVKPEETLMVGDSILRDLVPARGVSVETVWAEYGTHLDPADFESLVSVSHWTKDDVDRNRKMQEFFKDFEPDHTIQQYSELLEIV